MRTEPLPMRPALHLLPALFHVPAKEHPALLLHLEQDALREASLPRLRCLRDLKRALEQMQPQPAP